ncbi:hypothetical protein MMC10_005580 [Thelotrema lepadinum]|nr:hypothetical protein [Thelotrema lepadinum]
MVVTFDDFPNEIVEIIVSYAEDTEGLCSFSMTCYRFMEISNRFLKHKRRAFRIGSDQEPYPPQPGEDFSNPYPTGHKFGGSPIPNALHTLSVAKSYLLSICRHRKLSTFPDLAVIGECNLGKPNISLNVFSDFTLEDVANMGRALGSLGMKDQAKAQWISAIVEKGDFWACIKLIVLLLPNVRVISLNHDGVTDWDIVPWMPPRKKFLTNLTSVSISGCSDDEKAFSVAWPFLFQPSVTLVCCVGSGRFTRTPAQWPGWAGPSNLTELYLHESFLSDEVLRNLFFRTPKLERLLYYSHTALMNGSTRYCNTLEGLNVALSLLAHTLVHLSIRMDPIKLGHFQLMDNYVAADHSSKAFLDFSAFTQLRDLDVDWFTTVPFSIDEPSQDSTPLVNALPPNLQKLMLGLYTEEFYYQAVYAHVGALMRMKRRHTKTCLPQLKRLILDCYTELDEENAMPEVAETWKKIQKLGRRAEIEVSVENRSTQDPADLELEGETEAKDMWIPMKLIL